MTELEKLNAGLEYCYDDEEVDALKERAILWCQKYNALDPLDFEAQAAVLRENLGSMGEKVWIAKTFNCDNGKNIHIGSNFTGNYNITMLDIREIRIGDNVMIGPNTLITTVGHPLSPMGRRKHLGIAEPVTIGMVREMIDKAIDRSSRKFRFGKVDKDGGRVVLHEKDFSF